MHGDKARQAVTGEVFHAGVGIGGQRSSLVPNVGRVTNAASKPSKALI